MKKHLGQEWDSYQRKLLRQAGPVQIQETRRAFYAGALAFHSILLREASPGDEVTSEDEQLMQDLTDELREFLQEVVGGRA